SSWRDVVTDSSTGGAPCASCGGVSPTGDVGTKDYRNRREQSCPAPRHSHGSHAGRTTPPCRARSRSHGPPGAVAGVGRAPRAVGAAGGRNGRSVVPPAGGD